MKNLPKIFLSVISSVLVLVTSCVEERAGMEQPSGNLPSLDVQVAAMESSLAEIKSVIDDVRVSETLSEPEKYTLQLEASSDYIQEHIASVESGMSLVEASLGVMSIQAVLASVVGALEGEMFVESSLVALSQSVSLWLGQDFQYYYFYEVRKD